ncbi:MAG TPA: NDP-sugar synthase [Actinomycetota bacterium]|nr:NDP-sugar synthase [Actinomycetota bacterium]
MGVHTKIGAEPSNSGEQDVKAVMLVGGLGTRLRPLTLDTKKELMPVANRPFLEHVLANLARHGVDEAILTTGYLAEAFEDFPEERTHGVRLVIVRESEPLDTCGAVKNVERHIDGTFLVLNGDILTGLDISSLVRFHRERETLGTLTLHPVEDPSAYGLVPIDEDGRIERFIEKPRPEEIVTNLINAGTYVLEPEILDYVPAGVPYSFERVREGGLFPLLLAEGEALYGYVSNEYWLDIGTPEKYVKANRDVVEGLVGIDPAGVREGGRVWLGRGVDIDESALVQGPCVVGDGTTIGRGATVGPRSCVGNDCRIGEGATIAESVLHDGVEVASEAAIRGSVLARGVRIGAGTIAEGAILGSGVHVGASNELRPGIRVWSGVDIPDRGITFSSK